MKTQTSKPNGHPTPLLNTTKDVPTPFKFDCLEDQARHALLILRILERMFDNAEHLEGEDFDAAAGLLLHVIHCLEPLDLEELAGDLDRKA